MFIKYFFFILLLALNACVVKHDCSKIIPRIKKINIQYYNLDNKIQNDYIYALDVTEKHIKNIFKELNTIFFNVNHASCFNCRGLTSNPSDISIHGFGMAIDINPEHNPYLIIDLQTKQITQIIPANGINYINRKIVRPNKPDRIGMIDDKVVKIFRNNGFQIWGGDWDFPIDYMHFQSSKALSKLLLQMEFEDAQIFFDLNVKYLRLNPQEKIGNDDLFTAMLNNCNQKEDKCVLYEYLSDTEGFLKKAKQIATKK